MKDLSHISEPRFSRVVHAFVKSSYKELKVLIADGDVASFSKNILQLLPEVKRYINHNLKLATSKNLLPHNKYEKDDILDSLLIKIHDEFYQVKNEDDLYPWIFQKATNLINSVLRNEDFEEHYFLNIDHFTKVEWNEMKENYTSNMDGDPILLDDLDDSDLEKSYDYATSYAFVEDDNELELELFDDTGFTLQDFNSHVDILLYNIPRSDRNIFELNTLYQFYPFEIATINKSEIYKIEKSLSKTRKKIAVSLEARFLQRNEI